MNIAKIYGVLQKLMKISEILRREACIDYYILQRTLMFLRDEIWTIIFQYLKIRKATSIGNYVSGLPPALIFENMTI